MNSETKLHNALIAYGEWYAAYLAARHKQASADMDQALAGMDQALASVRGMEQSGALFMATHALSSEWRNDVSAHLKAPGGKRSRIDASIQASKEDKTMSKRRIITAVPVDMVTGKPIGDPCGDLELRALNTAREWIVCNNPPISDASAHYNATISAIHSGVTSYYLARLA